MFYERLSGACAKKGISVSALLDKKGLSRSAIGRWKNGGVPNGKTVSALAEELDVSVGYLLEGEEQIPAVDDGGGKWAEFIKVWRQLSPEQQALLYGTAKEMLPKR